MTSPALPYTEAAAPADVYADAVMLAGRYPVRHLPYPGRADLAETEQRWRRLTDHMTAETDLGSLYGD